MIFLYPYAKSKVDNNLKEHFTNIILLISNCLFFVSFCLKTLLVTFTFSLVLECYKSACDIYMLVFLVLSFLLHSSLVLTNLLSEIYHRFCIRPIVNCNLINVAVLLFHYFSPKSHLRTESRTNLPQVNFTIWILKSYH